MPQFSYEARDASGHQSKGQMQAGSADELIKRLSSQGLRVLKLSQTPSGTGQSAPASRPIQQSAPISQPQPQQRQAPAPPQTAAKSQAAPQAARKRGPAVNQKHVSLVLNQLADLLKAGITPAEALNQLAARTWSPKMGGAVKRMSAKASAGVPLSEAMEAEPELFAPSTVGAVRSGETSGNLWQSIDVCAKQIMEAQQYAKGFWWVKYFGPVAGFVLVLSLMLRGFLRSGVDAVMADTMQEGTTREQMVDGSLASLSSPAGIFTLAILIALSVGLFWLLSPAAWSFRHKMAMKIPILKAHARGESMSHFLWHMGQLSKAGITPWTAWKLAALAAPNQVMQQELSQAGQGASENMNISLLTQQGRMLPQEYQALLETGEATGTLPQALDQVSIASMQDSQTSSKSFKVAVLVAKGVMMVVVWISAFVIFYFSYMNYALQQMGEV